MTEAPLMLKPEYDMYPAGDGSWRIAGPGDRFDRVDLPPGAGDAVARALASERAGPAPDAVDDEVLAAFVNAGYAVPRPGRLPTTMQVCLLGGAPYLALVADLLKRAGATVVERPEDAAVRVFGQQNLDDEQMGAWDAAATDAGVPRHRAFFEGGRWFVGPFTLPGKTASYADYRARRLAACELPDELAAYWRALPQLSPRAPSPAVSALVAGLLVGDVLALMEGSPPPTFGYQVEIDPANLLAWRHPVLPLPRGLWDGS